MYVSIIHDRRSYEIEVEFGLLGEEQFSLLTLLDAVGETGLPGYCATDRDQVRKRVWQIANLIKPHAAKFLHLEANPIELERLLRARTKKADQYMLDMRLSMIREKLDQAWKTKDYQEAVRLLESMIQEERTKSESKKLDCARKKLSI